MPAKLELPEEEIVILYQNGKSTRQIAALFDCDKDPILRILKENKISLYNPKTKGHSILNQYKEQIIHDYRYNNQSLRKIAKQYNVEKTTIRRFLIKCGIDLQNIIFNLICNRCGDSFQEKKNYRRLCRKCKKDLYIREIIPLELRRKILARDNYTCQYCGQYNNRLDNKLEIEHKIPLCRGGTNDIDNLCVACEDCNDKKFVSTDFEFLKMKAR